MPETPTTNKQKKQNEVSSLSSISPTLKLCLEVQHRSRVEHEPPPWLTSLLPALLEPPCIEKHPNNAPLHLTRVAEALSRQEWRLLELAELCEEHSAEHPASACQAARPCIGHRAGGAGAGVPPLAEPFSRNLLITIAAIFQSWESRIPESCSLH